MKPSREEVLKIAGYSGGRLKHTEDQHEVICFREDDLERFAAAMYEAGVASKTERIKELEDEIIERNGRIGRITRLEIALSRAVRERATERAVSNKLLEALEKLARLGNGDRPGNSIGNQIALDAIAEVEAMRKGQE